MAHDGAHLGVHRFHELGVGHGVLFQASAGQLSFRQGHFDGGHLFPFPALIAPLQGLAYLQGRLGCSHSAMPAGPGHVLDFQP